MAGDLVPATYVDAFQRRRRVRPEARSAVVRAMGLAQGRAPRGDEAVIARPGQRLPAHGEVVLEDGTDLGMLERLPRDAPYGYHALRTADGRDRLLICGPGRCHAPEALRAWGWAVQLAATRSRRSWGIGDLDDLRLLARGSAAAGAGFVAVGPLGTPNPSPDPEPSPYYPSSRRFGNVLHVAVDLVPGSRGLPAVRALGERARELNAQRTVDRAKVHALKLEALELIWRAAPDRGRFEAWRAAQDPALERWGVFATLSERLGPGWRSWPPEYRRPDGAAPARTARSDAERVAFHAWCQWQFERQLARAAGSLPRIGDMPVGTDPGGFDAWEWQDQLAMDATVGAPPDRFSPHGQDWGLPPFIPHRLRQARYRPFIETIRAQLRHAGGLRIDHVIGLFRLWWVPAGSSPADGAYVTMPTAELLEIVALESQRAGALIIGEDLGTVPVGVRAELRRRHVLSTRVALFERLRPSRYPRHAYAAVTTHDLPTMAGLWSADDPDAVVAGQLRRRLVRAAALNGQPPLERTVLELHRRLAASPAMLVAATLEDALGVEERPNLPGTLRTQRANWSLALPRPLEAMVADPRVRALAGALSR